jgi:GNAT superfamily N-acetyltransferase
MSKPSIAPSITIGTLRKSEVGEAARIVRLAFGTFLGIPDPLSFMDDRNFITPRFRSPHVKVIAARDAGRLIGSNVITRWGSFGYFGPLTVLPEYWECGVAQRLLEATAMTFDAWRLRHTGLYTFPHSAKHVHLYQKFGYWPRYLTAILSRTPQPGPAPTLLSGLKKDERARAIAACRKLTHGIDKGLDLSDEIGAALKQRTGDVVLTYTRTTLDAFAICLTGPASEGGEKICYVKFAAARGGAGAEQRFAKLLDGIDGFAAPRSVTIEAGVNLSREGAYRQMRAHGYKVLSQGVAMQRPHATGFNHPEAWIIDDWR